jgi:hypothetical protein
VIELHGGFGIFEIKAGASLQLINTKGYLSATKTNRHGYRLFCQNITQKPQWRCGVSGR